MTAASSTGALVQDGERVVTFLRKKDLTFVKQLGAGACGLTVLLRDDQIDEYFVCKKYAPVHESMRESLYKGFLREVKLLHRLQHRNIVRLFHCYLYPDKYSGYILMEYVPGTSVDEFVREHPERINDIFVQTVNGFAHLHSQCILHRDIRPSNLMVAEDGTAKIIDLGFGKFVRSSVDFDKSISLNWWCPLPEEFGAGTYDYSTEVYFVGRLFEKILDDESLSHFEYRDLLRRMCALSPVSRPKSFAEIASAIDSKRIEESEFSDEDRHAYQFFASSVSALITKIEEGTKYVDGPERVAKSLESVYRKVKLESKIPDTAIVLRCLLDGTYYYRKQGMPVEALKDFVNLLRRCSPERGHVVFANLHTRLDAIQRYDASPAAPAFDDDIPF